MIKGATSTGFEFELDDSRLNNYELIDALAETSGDNPLSVVKVVNLLLGDKKNDLLNHCRAENGTVPISRVMEEITDIFKANDHGKNS